MKVTVTYNDKSVQVNLTDAQLETLGLKEKKKPTGYERVEHNDRYYCWDPTRWCAYRNFDVSGIDASRYIDANYYSDEKIAEANIRADRLMRKLRRFAAENGGIPSAEDWKDASMKKYFIDAFYSNVLHGSVSVELGEIYCTRDVFQIYFKSEEACYKAIEEFKDELAWYFAEYQAMLY